MSYRASAVQPTTRWAHHLDAVMRERDWSRVRLFEEVGGEMGYAPKSRSAFLRLLGDDEPTEAQAEVLRRHFGEPPELPAEVQPVIPAAGSADYAALIAALTAQTEVMRELIQEMRVQGEKQAGMNEGLATLAGRVVQVIEGR